MADVLAGINVPDLTPSGVFPLAPEFGWSVTREPVVVVHRFENKAANRKIEQRFVKGDGMRRFVVQKSVLTKAESDALYLFWSERKGPYQPFQYTHTDAAGGTETVYVRFADAPFEFDWVAAAVVSTGLELVEVPWDAQANNWATPDYTVASTDTRFPGGALATALTSQLHRLVPLLVITPRDTSKIMRLSDRRCTVAGDLFQARLVDWGPLELSKNGEVDQASFTLGNADDVLSKVAEAVNLRDARIEFSLFHQGTGVKLDLWAGYLEEFDETERSAVRLRAVDGIAQMTQPYPPFPMVRSCWKKFGSSQCGWTSGLDTTHFPSASGASCDKSYDGPNGCLAHQNKLRYGGVLIHPQGAQIKDNSTGFLGMNRSKVTATSVINDGIYGAVPAEVFTDDEMPVDSIVAAGRDESDFYNALGIIGRGPLTSFAAAGKHLLDGQPCHGAAKGTTDGFRIAYGADPAGATDFFSLDVVGNQTGGDWRKVYSGNSTYDDNFAAGLAFATIRRSDAKGIQPSSIAEHKMQVFVTGGLGGWTWTAPGARSLTAPLTNPVWVFLNTYLRGRGLFEATAAEQEATFDVAAAVAAAAVCDSQVASLIDGSLETQFKFRGTIGGPTGQKPLKQWLEEIQANYLGYFRWDFGRLAVGVRSNSSVTAAYTEGNILARSLRRSMRREAFNRLIVNFADRDYEYQGNAVVYTDEDSAAANASGSVLEFRQGTLNLVGTSTKSQAMRIAIANAREELGGINETEQRKARRYTMATTILGLDTAPGDVISFTGPEVPDGYAEGRVNRMRVNPDFSVEIEWASTTDGMYDMVNGPKPVDIAPAVVPTDPVDLVPADVRAISGQAFQIAAQTIEDSNGVKWKAVDLTYDPPSPLNLFWGVNCWVELPNGKVLDAGLAQYNGDGSGSAPGRYGTLRILLSPPAAEETWRVYLTSASRAYRKPLKLSTAPDPTPYRNLLVSPVDPIGPPTTPGPAGTEWAAAVTSFAASVTYKTSEAGDQIYGFSGSWVDPADTKYAGMYIVARPTGGGADIQLTGLIPYGQLSFQTDYWPVRYDSEQFDLYAVSANKYSQRNSIQAGVTPKVTVTVQKQTGPAGQEYAPNVTNFVCVVDYSVDEAGDERYRFRGSWTLPADRSKFRGVNVVLNVAGAQEVILAKEYDGATAFTTDWWPVPDVAITVNIFAFSVDANNRQNSWTASTPAAGFTIQRQGNGGTNTEYAPHVTGFSATVVYTVNEAGVQRYGFSGSWTNPVDKSRYRGAFIVARIAGQNDRILAKEFEGATSFRTDDWPVPDNAETWDIYAVSADANDRMNSIGFATPRQTVTVQKQASGSLKLNRADAFSFNAAEFQISGPVFEQKAINADKVTIGTTLKVGGGESPKPGKVGVFNAFDQIIGWIGTDSGYQGGWFKELRVGGSSPASAKLVADSNGNLVISGATFTLNLNGVTTTIDNAFLGGYTGLRVKNNFSQAQGMIGDGWIQTTRASDGTTMVYMGQSGSAGMLYVADDFGSVGVELRGIAISVQGKQVLGIRKTGWTQPSGGVSRASYVTETATTYDVALRLSALIIDLYAHGLIRDI